MKKVILISFTVLFIIAGLIISYPYLYTMFSKYDDGQCLKEVSTGKVFQVICKRTANKVYFAFEVNGNRNELHSLDVPVIENTSLFQPVSCALNK